MSTTEKIRIEPPTDLPREMVLEFLKECRYSFPPLKEAVDRSDYKFARSFGHQLKGTGRPYGFTLLTETGAALELAALKEDANEVRKQTDLLGDYLTRIEIA